MMANGHMYEMSDASRAALKAVLADREEHVRELALCREKCREWELLLHGYLQQSSAASLSGFRELAQNEMLAVDIEELDVPALKSLLASACRQRDFERMQILVDALQERGCSLAITVAPPCRRRTAEGRQ
jgi:hypothetical protein